MNTKRKLIILAIAAAVTACSAPQEKPQTPPLGSVSQSPVAETAKAVPAERPAEGVVILPLDQPPAAPAVSEPVAQPEPVPEPEVKMPAETPPSAPMAAPAVEAAPPAQQPMSMPPPAAAKPLSPSKPMTVVADRVQREFALTLEHKNTSHPYYGSGHDMGFVVDGVQGKELVLTRGVTYTFHVQTNVQHDFYFTTSPVGRGAGTVTDGITGQFTYRGDVTFTPTAATPDVVYYECRNHKYMGGKIHIANAGDKVTVGGAPVEVEKTAATLQVVSEAQVKQKMSYAEMLLGSSPAAKRVAASANAEAKNMLAQAQQQIGSAKSALSAGDTAAAMEAVNESLRLVSAAGRLVPSDVAHADLKPRYVELLDQLHGFEKSYQKNLAKGMKPKSGKELDKAKFERLVKEAEGYAAKEEYGDGVKRLESANEMLTTALGELLDSQTVVYDKNFATPQEEYEFELSRYNSYAELIPIAIEQRKPSEDTQAVMNELSTRAKEIHDEGAALAAKGDHKMAIMALQAATERLQKALRLAGVQ